MKQSKINNAYGALTKLAHRQLPAKTAFYVYKLTKKVEEIYSFAVEQERKLIDKYHAEIQSDGMILFKNASDKESFQAEFAELNNLEHDIGTDPIVIKIDDLGEQTLSMSDIFALEDFITFE